MDRSEQLHVIPSTYDIEDGLKLPGTKVLMKAASKMPIVKETLKRNNLKGAMIENCGMPEEHSSQKGKGVCYEENFKYTE